MPKSFHHGKVNFNKDPQIKVMWSRCPAGNAIVFVHGYSGDRIKTWREFDTRLPVEAKAAGYDVFLYGYDGVYGTTFPSSVAFYNFLDEFFQHPSNVTNGAPPPAEGQRPASYRRIIVVAHSLGAILARWALVMAQNEGRQWMKNVELVLFAPAHNGARPRELLQIGLGGIGFLRFFLAGVFYKSPLIQELDPVHPNSTIPPFRAAVRKAAKAAGNPPYLTAKMVIHAGREGVVINGPFENDPLPTDARQFARADHSAVCKPVSRFLHPLTVLTALL
jgi:pimeloyl-ACP methyl ester carboxylesterase